MRILIAEDDSRLLKSLVHIFELNNYAVDGVDNRKAVLYSTQKRTRETATCFIAGRRCRTFFELYCFPGDAVSEPSPTSPRRFAASSLILYLSIFPAAFIGKLSTNSIYFGTL